MYIYWLLYILLTKVVAAPCVILASRWIGQHLLFIILILFLQFEMLKSLMSSYIWSSHLNFGLPLGLHLSTFFIVVVFWWLWLCLRLLESVVFQHLLVFCIGSRLFLWDCSDYFSFKNSQFFSSCFVKHDFRGIGSYWSYYHFVKFQFRLFGYIFVSQYSLATPALINTFVDFFVSVVSSGYCHS